MQDLDLVKALEKRRLISRSGEQFEPVLSFPLYDERESPVPRSKPSLVGLLLEDVQIEEVAVQLGEVLVQGVLVGQADGQTLALCTLQLLGK